MPTPRSPLGVLLVSALLLAACQGTASSSPANPGTAAPSAGASEPASAAPPSVAGPTSPEEAAELVLASDPRFAGFGPQDPNLIGQCCWYEVTQKADGYQVLVHAGWGDCPSGCIEKHEWIFDVSPSGEVTLVEESGDPVPADGIPGNGT